MTVNNLNFNFLDEDSTVEAIENIGTIAEENNIKWALVGGLAMVLYGSDRLTKDIDVIAERLLPVPKEQIVGKLVQGGERYIIKTHKKEVAVDWIIRNDEFKKLFQIALDEAVKLNDVPILSPEWLVILKFIAGRFKDQEDAVYLLSRKDLVNRNLIKSHIVRVVGATAWGLAKHGYQRWYEIADGKSRDEESNEKDGYIDS